MAISQAMVTSFKVGVLDGTFDFSSGTSQVFKIALFTSSATLDATTTAYAVTNEVSGTGYVCQCFFKVHCSCEYFHRFYCLL